MACRGVHFALTPDQEAKLLEAAGDDEADDREYAWEYLSGLKEFWRRAAEEGRSVVFTVDQ